MLVGAYAGSGGPTSFYCSFTMLLLPWSTFTAVLQYFYCLCRLLLPLSTFTAFDYWMSKLDDRINAAALQVYLRIPTNSVAVKRQVYASTVYSSTRTDNAVYSPTRAEKGYRLTTLLSLRPIRKTGYPLTTNDIAKHPMHLIRKHQILPRVWIS